MNAPSLLKRREIIDALRLGTVPRRGLELFAVGLERFEKAIDEGREMLGRQLEEFWSIHPECRIFPETIWVLMKVDPGSPGRKLAEFIALVK